MKLSQLLGQRIKDTPKEAESISHIFLLRGGYIRPVSSGVYTLLPLAKRIITKIEALLRSEMDKVNSQEILMPLINPAEIWQQSGRYEAVDETLLRFKDRNNKKMVLAMTHEEAVCTMAKTEISSYKQLPASVYQIQTKYRDEARPRAGLIRVREFTMKDAYSFHENEDCLQETYDAFHKAYERFFKKVGLKEVLSIESDTGMIGGSISHEFMAISDSGEDTIFASLDRSYKANMEVATSNLIFVKEEEKELEKIETINTSSIDDVCTLLNIDATKTAKCVFYEDEQERLIFVVIRGDLQVNETKVRNITKSHVLHAATKDKIRSINAQEGYASLLNINPKDVIVLVDRSVSESSNLVCGANEENYHYINYNYSRDTPNIGSIVDIAVVRENDPCPITNTPLQKLKGIEVGNIFQLQDKYSSLMQCSYLDKQGKSQVPLMGCYGIGVGRTMASVIEQSHDKYGPIWPLSIAPWQVHIIALQLNKDEVRETSFQLYETLQEMNIEVLFDDRNAKAGFAFNDADLIGIPFRVIISPKTLADNKVEFKMRDGSENSKISVENIADYLREKITLANAR